MKNLLATQYAGLSLKTPIIIGSSGLTNTVEKNKELEKSGAGAVVLKSLFEEQISMSTDTSFSVSDNYPEAIDYINSYTKDNNITTYLNLIKESKEACHIPIIASINCYKKGSWINFAHQVEMAGASAIELNLFRLQTELYEDPATVEKEQVQILREVKEAVNIPVIVKIGKRCSNIPHFVNLLYANGAAGVVLFNRHYQPDIDIHKLQIVSGQVFSTHIDIAETLRWTGIVSCRIPQISIASANGIHDWEDMVKCILAGACATQLCSTVYQNGLEIISQILRSTEEWMISMNFNSISDFRGKLNCDNIPEQSLYERVQFMKYFSNRD